MNKFFSALPLVAFILFFSTANAQYEHILTPQEAGEAELFRKNKVRAQLQKMHESGKVLNYRARAFDTEGRVIEDINFFRQRYYKYDDKGRVTAHLDSIRKDENSPFEEFSYGFTYDDANNILKAVSLPPDESSTITYDKGRRILTERNNYNDTIYIHKYYYDKQNRLIASETYNEQNVKLKRFARQIASNGKTHMETSVEYIESGGKDSVVTYYIYNSDFTLAKKLIYTETVLLMNPDGGSKPTHSAKQNYLESYNYIYDEKGRKISEEYTHSLNKFAKLYSTWQYDNRGLPVKSTTQRGKFPPVLFEYEYVFYP